MSQEKTRWKGYKGSSKLTSKLTIAKKTILEVCCDKINLTYCEQKWLMRLDVLCDDTYLNQNIAGKFFDGKIIKGL